MLHIIDINDKEVIPTRFVALTINCFLGQLFQICPTIIIKASLFNELKSVNIAFSATLHMTEVFC